MVFMPAARAAAMPGAESSIATDARRVGAKPPRGFEIDVGRRLRAARRRRR